MQQPLAHEVASQTHCPVALLHSWPVAQDPQAAPLVPHEPLDSEAYGSQVLPLQQPFGHDAALQTHAPLLHVWPAAHAKQFAPPAPHDEAVSLESGSHVEPLQQPPHEPPPQLQTPFVHESPVPHALHAAPAVPHWPADCPV